MCQERHKLILIRCAWLRLEAQSYRVHSWRGMNSKQTQLPLTVAPFVPQKLNEKMVGMSSSSI